MPLFLILLAGLLTGVSALAADGEGTNPTLAKVEGAVEHGAHAAASGVERGVHAAARGIKHGAKATARGIDRGAHAAARGVKHGAEATGKAVHKAANKVEGSGDASAASRPAK
jgi:hypothetical protein